MIPRNPLKVTRGLLHNWFLNNNAVPKPNLNPIFFYCTQKLKCWQCGIERDSMTTLFCAKCNHLQPPHNVKNYFQVLNVEENFEVNLKDLTNKYRDLQRQLHPDKYTNRPKQEKIISEEFSALVNRAYSTLQTPLSRALHLLHLKGDSVEEGQTVQNPEFLMEIMELNEEVENANCEQLKALRMKNDLKMEQISEEIKSHFNDDKITNAKESIIKMKYYQSVNLHINELMREKGIVD